MKRRIISLLLAAVTLWSTASSVNAADFDDTAGHWAREYIDECITLNLFNGITETTFEPEGTMTRGMFVTVLGRLEGVDTSIWSGKGAPDFFKDVPPGEYYAPYIRWAVCKGIVDGISYSTFAPNAPVTREQMAKLIAFYVEAMGHRLKTTDAETIRFADAGDIASWATSSVDSLVEAGILNGLKNADGSYSFLPQKTSTRAECAAVFSRIASALIRGNVQEELPAKTLTMEPAQMTLAAGERQALTIRVTPQPNDSQLHLRISDPSIFSLDAEGYVTGLQLGSAEITAYTSNGLWAKCRIDCTGGLASADETYEEKCIRVFGKVVDNPKYYYAIYDEKGNYVGIDYDAAEADMVSITVPAWDLNSQGNKYTRYFTIKVHKNLAATYKQIFKEIYEGEEKFPFYYVWSYSESGRSEHSIGTAVDLNPNENYYYNSRTGEQVGDYWKPGEDPYSIPADGEVARIFKKYGFSQGIWTYTVDYMHFSYFGT